MWFGLLLMVAMMVGLVWWMVWAMKKGKGKDKTE
jgi:cbb3-type cytochrome oxidase subunit 3